MLQRQKPGLIIWGAILTVIGLNGVCIGLFSLTGRTNSARSTGLVMIMIFMIPLILGLILLIVGIVRAANIAKCNRQKLAEWRTCEATCYSCHTLVRADRTQFQGHRNFPEGFIFCPACKKPLSLKLFYIVKG